MDFREILKIEGERDVREIREGERESCSVETSGEIERDCEAPIQHHY